MYIADALFKICIRSALSISRGARHGKVFLKFKLVGDLQRSKIIHDDALSMSAIVLWQQSEKRLMCRHAFANYLLGGVDSLPKDGLDGSPYLGVDSSRF